MNSIILNLLLMPISILIGAKVGYELAKKYIRTHEYALDIYPLHCGLCGAYMNREVAAADSMMAWGMCEECERGDRKCT